MSIRNQHSRCGILLNITPHKKENAFINIYSDTEESLSFYIRSFFKEKNKVAAIADLGQEYEFKYHYNDDYTNLDFIQKKGPYQYFKYEQLTLLSYLFEVFSGLKNSPQQNNSLFYNRLYNLIKSKGVKSFLTQFIHIQFLILRDLGLICLTSNCFYCHKEFSQTELAFIPLGTWYFSCKSCLQFNTTSLRQDCEQRQNLFNFLRPKDSNGYSPLNGDDILNYQKWFFETLNEYIFFKNKKEILEQIKKLILKVHKK